MKVDITKDEFEKLLDLVYIADSVLTAHKTKEGPRAAAYEKIVQKFYALAGEMGQGGKIKYDADLGKYLPAEGYRESSEAQRLVDEFADETFWHELIYRFTERDLARQVGGYEKLPTLSQGNRFDLEMPIEEKYIDEFGENGIDRLEIVERFDAGGIKPKTSD